MEPTEPGYDAVGQLPEHEVPFKTKAAKRLAESILRGVADHPRESATLNIEIAGAAKAIAAEATKEPDGED